MMKNNDRLLDILFSVYITTLLMLLFFGCAAGVVYRESPRPAGENYREEYNIEELNAYGEWVYAQDYGNVWRPYVDPEWKPFVNGHWVYSNGDWTWISYEPFGWVVYHYGNWAYTPAYGWVWIPGRGPWSPARVQWVQYDNYVCWAPLAPSRVVWRHPWEHQDFDAWVVVRTGDFASDNVGAHRIARAARESEPYRGDGVVRKPEITVIQQHSSVPVRVVKIDKEKVVVGKREFHRMRIPDAEKERVQKFRAKVEKEVVRRSGERREAR